MEEEEANSTGMIETVSIARKKFNVTVKLISYYEFYNSYILNSSGRRRREEEEELIFLLF